MKDSLSVLLLCADPGVPLYGPSGASAHLRGVARALHRAGHSVTVAVPSLSDVRGTVFDPVDLPTLIAGPVPRLRLPGTHRETWMARDLLARAISGDRFDCIWERYSLWSDAGVRAHRRTGVRHILEINAPLSLERGKPGLERAVWQQAGEAFAVSAVLAERVRAVRGDCRHIANGTDSLPSPTREATRRRLGAQGLLLGFLGSHKPWHGLSGLPLLLDALPDARALVVGEGPVPVPGHPRSSVHGWAEPAELQRLLAAMDVTLAPYGPDAPDWFCPLKVLDSLAAGVPVVAADVGDCAHLLAHGGGIVVPPLTPSTVHQWAEGIRTAATMPRVSRPRSWDAVVAEVLG